MSPNPCRPDCPDRRAGAPDRPPCHATCPRYAAYRTERTAALASLRADAPAAGYFQANAAKVRRWVQRHRIGRVNRRR